MRSHFGASSVFCRKLITVTCLVRLVARLFIAVMADQKRTDAVCSQARSNDDVGPEDGDDQKRIRREVSERWTSPTRSVERLLMAEHVTIDTAPWDQLIFKEIWDIVICCLAVSPMTRMNGIAATCRIMNVRWRIYYRSIVRELLQACIQLSDGTSAHLALVDLEDIMF